MNQGKIFQNICEIYATSTFDIHLYSKIENLNEKKDSVYIAKKYIQNLTQHQHLIYTYIVK